MGSYAKQLFGKEEIGSVGIILGGTQKPEFEKEILSMFDEVLNSKDSVYHAHLVRKGKMTYPFVLNVYGAPAILDVMAQMYDGGCRSMIFVGYAYGGFNDLEVGSVTLPTKAYHHDGFYGVIDPDRKSVEPDNELIAQLRSLLDKIGMKYSEGINISVPSVTFQLPHSNEEYEKIQPLSLEMELASFYSRAKDLGIRAAAVLIISDNKSSGVKNESMRPIREKTKRFIIKNLIEKLELFDLNQLPSKDFNIDHHLASIVGTPQDTTNVYKKAYEKNKQP